jgi:excisionase family DNA binding protein
MSASYQHKAGLTRQKEVTQAMEKLLSVDQAAQRLGVSFWTVYRLARSGRLASVQLGRRRLFAEHDLEDLVQRARRDVRSPAPESERRKKKESGTSTGA